MSDLTADVLEWLRAKAARQRYITREQADILMTYADGETIANISRKTELGLLVRRNKSSGSHTIPWNSPLRCKCCGILLEFADYQENGLCDWCYENPRKVAEKCKDIEQAIIELDNALTIHEDAVQAVEGRAL